MRPASLLYLTGVFLLAVGIAVVNKEPAAVPITMGIGFLIAALVKFLEGK